MNLKIKNKKGFSLTEVIITVLIIAILGAISGPIYNSYSTKSKQAEGYLLLGTIKDAQMKHYNDCDSFLCHKDSGISMGFSCNDNTLGIDARANKYYTVFSPNRYQWAYGGKSAFCAVVQGVGVTPITMIYSITSGTTFK